MRNWFYFLLIYFCSSTSYFSQLSETITVISSNEMAPLTNWELYLVKDYTALPFSTTPILIKNSKLYVDSVDLKKYKGVCWFRKKVYFDMKNGQSELALCFKILGAAEVYVNKKRVIEMGRVGFSYDSEDKISSDDKFVIIHIEKGKEYEILIRYGNYLLETSYDRRGQKIFGISVTPHVAPHIIETKLSYLLVNNAAGIFLISFYFILCFVHLIIYFFNKYEVSNLYYSIICFIAAAFTLSNIIENYVENVYIISFASLLAFILMMFLFFFLPFMFRSFFKMANPKWYKYLGWISVVGVLIAFISIPISSILFGFVILTGTIETVRVIVIALRAKKQGAKIIGSGTIFFTLMMIAVSIAALFQASITTNNNYFGIFLIIFFFLSVAGIPISITVYLAYSISLTNKSLSNKLMEVEELSTKNLEQEKEKQQILANQNQTLEKQVFERTIEITEQKKVIEEKNKDIIDSINYAKRIQSAMLPDELSFKTIFANSFVLYQPRDIVSGDFYYATELNGQKLIIAADCTGHGVPGALMSMVGCNIINKITHENSIVEPKIVLETLHSELRHALKQDLKGSVNRDGMDVSAVMITDTEIVYAGANRPLIWFNKQGELQELKPSKTPIGGSHIEAVNIEQIHLPKANVKQLFLFSDGFADQFGGPDGKKLMISKFKLWLSQVINLNPSEQQKFLENGFAQWKKESEQVDDVMVIGIKI